MTTKIVRKVIGSLPCSRAVAILTQFFLAPMLLIFFAIPTVISAETDNDVRIAILSVSAIPQGEGLELESAVFEYPQVKSIDIAVTIRLDAANAVNATLFVSGIDQDGSKIGKGKLKEKIQPGETRLVIKDFLVLNMFYGEHDVTLNIEVSAERAGTVKSKRAFSFIGLPKPELKVDYIDLRPRNEPLYLEFIPGESFSFNIFFEVQENDAELNAQIRVFAILDEQSFEIDRYSLSDPFWDKTDFEAIVGYYRIELFGRLPDKFIEYYKERHYFRVVVEIEFEGGIRYLEFGEGLIYDEFYGEYRNPYVPSDAYIQLEPSVRWRIDKLESDAYEKRIRDHRELKRQQRFSQFFNY